ncbi:TPM domain-containing protein [Foetidibacter luteolus]|uniref:TPM domain-containing protein n=1 Tax=Foetidibacter luteolus TaxID=2608880 RepID=UPI00129B5E86|nr:TPM domain-containing protein [Foetidibacter luteolus]
MFSLFKKKAPDFFEQQEKEKILAAIKTAEQRTSGEVRVFIESHCRFVNPLDRAYEVFYGLKMQETEKRNGVLVYVAMKDRQLAIFADEGIYGKAGETYWNNEVKTMLKEFGQQHHADGIAQVVLDIGELLNAHFPYDAGTDKNELPDDIVFGR